MSKFYQTRAKKADFNNHLYRMCLLFEEEPSKPNLDTIQEALIHKFGEIDVVSLDESLRSFAIKNTLFNIQTEACLPQL